MQKFSERMPRSDAVSIPLPLRVSLSPETFPTGPGFPQRARSSSCVCEAPHWCGLCWSPGLPALWSVKEQRLPAPCLWWSPATRARSVEQIRSPRPPWGHVPWNSSGSKHMQALLGRTRIAPFSVNH